jgi:hypothetical protein
MGQVARVLDWAHGEGVDHGEVRPDNIMLINGFAMVAGFSLVCYQDTLGLASASLGYFGGPMSGVRPGRGKNSLF